jgi:hypothetical protein
MIILYYIIFFPKILMNIIKFKLNQRKKHIKKKICIKKITDKNQNDNDNNSDSPIEITTDIDIDTDINILKSNYCPQCNKYYLKLQNHCCKCNREWAFFDDHCCNCNTIFFQHKRKKHICLQK